jgi:hypothetical protein
MSDMNQTALAALIDETEARNVWTDRQVSKQAQTAGHKVTPSDVSLYRLQGMKQLVPVKIVGLAAGLRLPAYRVAVAVLEDAGISVPLDARSPEDAIHHDHTLSARTRETLLLIIDRDRSDA